MIISNILSFIGFPVLVIGGIKFEDRKDVLNKQDTDVIKGIAAMCIVLAHFYDCLVNEGIGIGKLWLYTGGIGVCLFFFLSGYGFNISRSYEKTDFLVRRIKSVLIPFVIVRIPCFFIGFSLGTKSIGYFLGYLVGIFEPQWFVSVIIIIYIGYYVCYRVLGKRWHNVAMIVYNIAIGILFYLLNMHERWYNAHLLFSVGMIVADYNESIIQFLKKRNWWITNIILGAVFFWCSLFFTMNKGSLLGVAFKILSGMGIAFLFYNFFLKVRLNSKILQYIGRNSLLVYIIHLQVLSVLEQLNNIPIELFLLLGILITFFCIGFYNIIQKHMNMVRRNS